MNEQTGISEVRKSRLLDRDKYAYAKNGEKTGSGRPSVDNGDAVAVALRGKTTAEVLDILADNGQEIPERWLQLNLGMQRMNASNVLRRLAKSDGVTIDGHLVRINQ